MNQTLFSSPKSPQSNDAIYETLTDFRKIIKQINPDANPYMIFENIKKWLNLQWLDLQDSKQAEYLNNIKTDIINEQNKITVFEQKDNFDDLVINNLVSKLWKSPLTSSDEFKKEKREIVDKIKVAIKEKEFTEKTDHLYALFYVILDLANPSLKLLEHLLKLVEEAKTKILLSTPEGKQYLEDLVSFNIIDNWRKGALLEDYFTKKIKNQLINHDNSFWLLVTYGYILRHSLEEKNKNKLSIPFYCHNEKEFLLNLRLVVKDENNQFKIANKIYEQVFNDDWLKETLRNLVGKDETKNNLLNLIKSDNFAEIVKPLNNNQIFSNHVQSILENTIYWTDGNQDLTRKILTFIEQAIVKYEDDKIEWFNKNIIFSRFLGNEKYEITESDFSSLISRLVLTTEGLNDKNHVNKNLIRLTTKFKRNPVLIADKILSETKDLNEIENFVDYILSNNSIIKNEDDVDKITLSLLEQINYKEELNMPQENMPESTPLTTQEELDKTVAKGKDFITAIVLVNLKQGEIVYSSYHQDVTPDFKSKMNTAVQSFKNLIDDLPMWEEFAEAIDCGELKYSIHGFCQKILASAYFECNQKLFGIFYLSKKDDERGKIANLFDITVEKIIAAFKNDNNV